MNEDSLTPVPRVLCQPDATKSCGACCGMYNHTDAGYSATFARLHERTNAYNLTANIDDPLSLRAFRVAWEPVGAAVKLLSGLPSCPFLGFVEPVEESSSRMPRVGCLVHPLQNDGVDGRDCGVYDRKTCEDYLCAAHDLLSIDERRLVLESVHDSYLYGIVITNMRLVKELLKQAASITSSYPTGSDLRKPAAVKAAGQFFELMRDWPYAARDGVFGPIVAGEDLETSQRKSPFEVLAVPASPFDGILTCLGTSVESVEDLENARRVVQQRVVEFSRALAG